MTIALALSALGVIAVLTGFGFYLAKMLKDAIRDWKIAEASWKVELEIKNVLATQVADLRRLNEEAQKTLSTKEEELARELAARKSVEKHREQLLAELAKTGNPSAVAAQIRKELDALAGLGQPAPAKPSR